MEAFKDQCLIFQQEYRWKMTHTIENIDIIAVYSLAKFIITAIDTEKRIFVCGNGGSLALAEHMMCDFQKAIFTNTGHRARVHTLTSSPLMSAIANDIGYEEVFSKQLEMSAYPKDRLLVISSSGNSPNIVRALKTAKEKGMMTAALVGFDGGLAKSLADISVHVPVNNYGIVEDAHSYVLHVISQFLIEYLKT
jgi:D-sedoheptulose 7-phosphate isomerase